MNKPWPKFYLKLERVYTRYQLTDFFNCTHDEGHPHREMLRQRCLDKRKDFNKLWNSFNVEQFDQETKTYVNIS